MSQEKELTFEEIDASVNSLNLSDYQPGAKQAFTAVDVAANPAGVLQKICSIYKGIRPILLAISKIPLIPAGWRTAIKTFIGLMDTLCP